MTQEEELFNEKLKEIFIGEKIEGKSGFANLMQLKSNYFDKIFEELNDEIRDKTEKFSDFREELYDKLYTFLKRYFTDSGSILYKRTTPDSKIYEKVYDNDKDVSLFWKTNMLYYVKTEKIWKPMTIEDYESGEEKYDIEFDVSELEGKRGNVKKKIIFRLGFVENNRIVFKVKRSSHGSKTKTDDIRRELNRKEIHLDSDDLEHFFKTYRKQNEVDFFINKDAKRFLKEQFDMWIKHYVMDDETVFEEKRLKKLKILKNIAYKIINFVSQFEDELVKIWNKPKFVLNSNYVVTLDRLIGKDGGKEIIKDIFNHDKFDEQLKEWKDLGIFDENEDINSLLEDGNLKKEYCFLPIDTKHFESLRHDILTLFENLNTKIDGWLIHSENYQALNTILPKFQEEIKTICIDPPYNRGNGADFIFRDNFEHSSWLSLMENRLAIAKHFLKDNGILYSNIDDNEVSHLRKLLESEFGEENVDCFVWKKASEGRWGKMKNVSTFRKDHEYILTGFKKEKEMNKLLKEPSFTGDYTNTDDDPRGPWLSGSISRKESASDPEHENYYTVTSPSGKEFSRQFDVPKEEFKELDKDNRIYWGKDGTNVPREKIFLNEERETNPYSVIEEGSSTQGKKEFRDIFGDKYEDLVSKINPKHQGLISTLCQIATGEDSLILDFFAGSGTTAQSVMKLNKKYGGQRKFLLVEMGDFFDNITLSRVKKVSYSFNWEEGRPQDQDGVGGFFKYYSLESYEQTLKKCTYETSEPFLGSDEASHDQYVFMKDAKMLDAMDLDFEEEKEKIDCSNLYSNVDLAETLSCLKGKKIKGLTKTSVTFEDGEKIDYNELDFETIKPLIWW